MGMDLIISKDSARPTEQVQYWTANPAVQDVTDVGVRWEELDSVISAAIGNIHNHPSGAEPFGAAALSGQKLIGLTSYEYFRQVEGIESRDQRVAAVRENCYGDPSVRYATIRVLG